MFCFSIIILKYQMPYPLGNRASKRICGKRIICGRIGVGGIGGEQLEARVLVRGSSGKDNCLLRVDFCLQIFFVS